MFYIFLIITLFIIYLFPIQKCSYVNFQKICTNYTNSDRNLNLLKFIQTNFSILISHLNETYPDSNITKNINKNYSPDTLLSEILYSKHVAYSKNKGDEIAFCLTDENMDTNTLIFVALHELSHIATDDVGHTYSFWTNYEFLLRCAVKLHIYVPKDYSEYPVKFCDLQITYSPLFNH